MNRAMGFSLRTPASDGACLRDGPRGARHWAHLRAAHSHEGNWCQASIALPHRNLLPLPYWSPRQPSLVLFPTRD